MTSPYFIFQILSTKLLIQILNKATRRKRVEECIEDRLDESAGEIIEQELEETTTDEPETKSSIKINVNISTTY